MRGRPDGSGAPSAARVVTLLADRRDRAEDVGLLLDLTRWVASSVEVPEVLERGSAAVRLVADGAPARVRLLHPSEVGGPSLRVRSRDDLVSLPLFNRGMAVAVVEVEAPEGLSRRARIRVQALVPSLAMAVGNALEMARAAACCRSVEPERGQPS